MSPVLSAFPPCSTVTFTRVLLPFIVGGWDTLSLQNTLVPGLQVSVVVALFLSFPWVETKDDLYTLCSVLHQC